MRGILMTTPIVKTAKESDEAGIIDALKLAFAADPATRWVWPDPQKYLSYFSSFARAFVGKAFANKSAHYIGNYSGGALWLPQNIPPDVHQLFALLQSTESNEAKKDAQKFSKKIGSILPHEP